MNEWTPEDVEALKSYITKGFTASQMSRQFGGRHSRNSCIGKCHRLGLSLTGQSLETARTTLLAQRVAKRRADLARTAERAERQKTRAPRPIISSVLPEPEFIGPINAFPPSTFQCLAIKGDPGVTDWQCCAQPITKDSRYNGRRYCDSHAIKFVDHSTGTLGNVRVGNNRHLVSTGQISKVFA